MEAKIGLISWNIGDNVNKINNLVQKLIEEKQLDYPDILVLGFQEYPSFSQMDDIKIGGYSLIGTFSSCDLSADFRVGIRCI